MADAQASAQELGDEIEMLKFNDVDVVSFNYISGQDPWERTTELFVGVGR